MLQSTYVSARPRLGSGGVACTRLLEGKSCYIKPKSVRLAPVGALPPIIATKGARPTADRRHRDVGVQDVCVPDFPCSVLTIWSAICLHVSWALPGQQGLEAWGVATASLSCTGGNLWHF